MRKDQAKIRGMIKREKKNRKLQDSVSLNFWRDDDDLYEEIMIEVEDHWRRFLTGEYFEGDSEDGY